MLLFVLIYRYLMALKVFESFNFLSYGFAFNIKGLSVIIVWFLSSVPGFANNASINVKPHSPLPRIGRDLSVFCQKYTPGFCNCNGNHIA